MQYNVFIEWRGERVENGREGVDEARLGADENVEEETPSGEGAVILYRQGRWATLSIINK